MARSGSAASDRVRRAGARCGAVAVLGFLAMVELGAIAARCAADNGLDSFLLPATAPVDAAFPSPAVAWFRRTGGSVAGPLGRNSTLALHDVQSETAIAAAGPFVVAAFNDMRGSSSFIGIARSSDGGETFIDAGQLPTFEGLTLFADPALAVHQPPGGAKVFYCASLYLAGDSRSVCIHRSTDGGATWEGPFDVLPATSATSLQDKEWCAVDPESGRLFVSWTRVENTVFSLMVTYSDDGGLSWSPAATLGTGGQGTVIACDPDGPNVYLAWRATVGTLRAIRFVRSTDNGLNWSPSVALAPSYPEVIPPYGLDFAISLPSLTVNPGDGGIELVYPASADGTPASDFGDIFYRRSNDGGQAFSAPVALDAFPGTDRAQFFPTVSAADDGRIDVFWYDESAGATVSDLTDLFYTFSTDLGTSWSSPVPVTASPFHNESGNRYSDHLAPHQGDYIDAVSCGATRGCFAWFGEPSPAGTAPDVMIATITDPVEVAALRVRPGTVGVADYGCGTDDGVLVAGEHARLALPLENFGRSALTGITATLTASSPEITVITGAQSYSSLAPGASAASNDSFVIALSEGYPCGAPARFRLDVAAAGVGPTLVELSLPTGVVVSEETLLSETFDAAGAPALPLGWSAVNLCSTCVANPWHTTSTTPASPPNAAHGSGETGTNSTFGRLDGPAVAVPAGSTLLEIDFDLQYDLEAMNSRVAIDAATFNYLLDGGQTRFATADAIEFEHRYEHWLRYSLFNGTGNRSAWSGNSDGYRHVRILIPDLGGHVIRPRFDLSTVGNSGAPGSTGVWVDNVTIKALTLGCGTCVTTSVPDRPLAFSFRIAGGNPFQRGTLLRYVLAEASAVRVEVFNVTGQRVRTLVDRIEEPGTHDVWFRLDYAAAERLAPGLYLARIVAGTRSRTLRLVAVE
jgi:hypothetical protein